MSAVKHMYFSYSSRIAQAGMMHTLPAGVDLFHDKVRERAVHCAY